ncbi:phosphoribosyltransferase [Candidatus Microgenomates bacterium]|nr:phosphoribosyltransferase [Candidatus Microgenomates bacterium]
MFKNRQSAGQLLAKRLKSTKADLVLAIPRGGVLVAKEIAKILKLPLDILVTRKIGVPMQPELALGAVDPDGEVVWDESLLKELRIKQQELSDKVDEELEEIKRREKVYRQGKDPLSVDNKTIILADDGIATGATTLAAIRYLKRHQVKRIVLAVPVASKESVDKISRELGPPAGEAGGFGEVVVLETPEYFHAVGQFYQHFEEVTDSEVVQLLRS